MYDIIFCDKRVVEVNRLFLKNYAPIADLCDTIDKLIKSGTRLINLVPESLSHTFMVSVQIPSPESPFYVK